MSFHPSLEVNRSMSKRIMMFLMFVLLLCDALMSFRIGKRLKWPQGSTLLVTPLMYSLLFVNATLLILYRGFNGGPHINDWSKFHCIIVSCLNFRSLSAVGESQLMIKMQVIGNPFFAFRR